MRDEKSLASTGANDVSALSLRLERGDRLADRDRERVEANRLEHLLGVGVDLKTALGLGVERRDFRNVLILVKVKHIRTYFNGRSLDLGSSFDLGSCFPSPPQLDLIRKAEAYGTIQRVQTLHQIAM